MGSTAWHITIHPCQQQAPAGTGVQSDAPRQFTTRVHSRACHVGCRVRSTGSQHRRHLHRPLALRHVWGTTGRRSARSVSMIPCGPTRPSDATGVVGGIAGGPIGAAVGERYLNTLIEGIAHTFRSGHVITWRFMVPPAGYGNLAGLAAEIHQNALAGIPAMLLNNSFEESGVLIESVEELAGYDIPMGDLLPSMRFDAGPEDDTPDGGVEKLKTTEVPDEPIGGNDTQNDLLHEEIKETEKGAVAQGKPLSKMTPTTPLVPEVAEQEAASSATASGTTSKASA
eukprot:1385214-Amphidinium_carterae.1